MPMIAQTPMLKMLEGRADFCAFLQTAVGLTFVKPECAEALTESWWSWVLSVTLDEWEANPGYLRQRLHEWLAHMIQAEHLDPERVALYTERRELARLIDPLLRLATDACDRRYSTDVRRGLREEKRLIDRQGRCADCDRDLGWLRARVTCEKWAVRHAYRAPWWEQLLRWVQV